MKLLQVRVISPYSREEWELSVSFWLLRCFLYQMNILRKGLDFIPWLKVAFSILEPKVKRFLTLLQTSLAIFLFKKKIEDEQCSRFWESCRNLSESSFPLHLWDAGDRNVLLGDSFSSSCNRNSTEMYQFIRHWNETNGKTPSHFWRFLGKLNIFQLLLHSWWHWAYAKDLPLAVLPPYKASTRIVNLLGKGGKAGELRGASLEYHQCKTSVSRSLSAPVLPVYCLCVVSPSAWKHSKCFPGASAGVHSWPGVRSWSDGGLSISLRPCRVFSKGLFLFSLNSFNPENWHYRASNAH